MNTPKKSSSQAITFPHRHSTELKAYLIGLHVYQLHPVIGYLAWRGGYLLAGKRENCARLLQCYGPLLHLPPLFYFIFNSRAFFDINLFIPSACKLEERMLKFLHVIVVLNRRKNPVRKKHGMQVCL